MSGHLDDQVAQTIEAILGRGLDRQASAIHIEPRPLVTLIRARADGRLHDIAKLPAQHHEALIKKLRDMADATGSFEHQVGTEKSIVRLHTVQLVDGEKVVLHINRRQTSAASLATRGYWGDNINKIEHALSDPHGMVQVASLDQASAHQTMLSLAQLLHDSHHNIMTVTADAPHDIEGINQLLSPQHEQAERLRYALQQDSDVIILGTVTDQVTAELAYEIGLGRHLLIGSVYASDVSQLLRRTIDMGTAPHLVASSLKLVVAERYAPRLCAHCRVGYAPSKAIIQKCQRQLGKADFHKTAHVLETQAKQSGIGSDVAGLSSSTETIGRLFKASPVGCSRCHFTGHDGRLTLNEVMPMGPAIQRAIITNQTGEELRRIAIVDGGMISQDWDGFTKALRGQVSLEETFGKQYR